MTKSYRIQRIGETIKEVISEVLLSGLKDPRVGLITITSVKVTRDMASAKVHYSVMGNELARQETKAGLLSARNFLRKAIAAALKTRNSPELYFVYDDSLDRSFRIEEALRSSSKNRPANDEADDE
jgi:ribosome-binding factor A